MPIALVRKPSPHLDRCELTHLAREPIDPARAAKQHRAYEELLVELGCTLVRLPDLPDHPDAVFVEDTAVVLDEVAINTRPGAESRRGEVASVAAALSRYRPLARIEAPATLDGGDVLRVGRRIFVGRSARTSAAGSAALAALVAPYGYDVTAVELHDCLHLKTAVCEVADDVVLMNPAWVDAAPFASFERVEVDPDEPFGANALRVGATLVHPQAYPRTRARLLARRLSVRPIPADELAKAEGGVTCCSVIVG